MKVCDVVLNSIWYDPRVRKQIIEYVNNDIDVVAIGFQCGRYDKEKIEKIPCKTIITRIEDKYSGKQSNIINKLKRMFLQEQVVIQAIVQEQPDIIHANDLNALIPAYKAKKKLNCKLIYDAHEVFWANFWDRKHYLYSRYLKLKERHICKKVDQMVCVSNTAAEYYKEMYKIEKPLVVTNCSLRSEQSMSNITSRQFEILNHGMFYSGRGYDIMVEAIPYLKGVCDIRLAIRGFGPIEEKLRSRVAEMDNKEIFRFYPAVQVDELIPMAAKSHVGVAITEPICMNFKLSVSNKLFEYASAGLPVIMSNIPEHRYLNNKYHFGIILSDDSPKTFADAVLKLYKDKEFYKRCARNSVKLSNEINWETGD